MDLVDSDRIIVTCLRHFPAPLRSSERRKLRARMTERFQLAPEAVDTLVPEGLLAQKFSAYNGEPGVRVLRHSLQQMGMMCVV